MNSTTDFAGPVPPQPEHPDASRRLLGEVLKVLRSHLAMDVAFISRVEGGRRTFDYVDSDPAFRPIEPGGSGPAEESFCARVLDGRAPQLVTDASLEPSLAGLAVTRELPVGSHLSVPVHTSGGEVYGTLCCFSRRVDPTLTEADVAVLRMFADVVGKHLEPMVTRQRGTDEARERITRVLGRGALRMALQPIVDLHTGHVEGFEALARFPANVGWPPDRWFGAAERVGLGTDLEAAAVEAALRLLPALTPAQTLSVNVSALALLDGPRIREIVCSSGAGPRLVLELTESHDVVAPAELVAALDEVRSTGVRLAIDDAGSGYAGLERILALKPEVLKLDRSLVHGIARHPGRQAMCEAMVGFTERTGARLIAEGVELRSDLNALRALRVGHAQGFLLGRPTVWSTEALEADVVACR